MVRSALGFDVVGDPLPLDLAKLLIHAKSPPVGMLDTIEFEIDKLVQKLNLEGVSDHVQRKRVFDQLTSRSFQTGLRTRSSLALVKERYRPLSVDSAGFLPGMRLRISLYV